MEFTKEAKLLACIKHKKCCEFVGYCAFSKKLLVYEYVDESMHPKLNIWHGPALP
ncbi:putative protein kinase-like domain superfamily [Helianthus anomalus]